MDNHDDTVRRLLAMHRSLADSIEFIESLAETAHTAGFDGLSFASHMLKDALCVWREEMTRYMTSLMEDDL